MGFPIERLRSILREKHLNGILISHQPNITYLTGFLSSDSYLLLAEREVYFITDSRYYHQAKKALNNLRIKLADNFVFIPLPT